MPSHGGPWMEVDTMFGTLMRLLYIVSSAAMVISQWFRWAWAPGTVAEHHAFVEWLAPYVAVWSCVMTAHTFYRLSRKLSAGVDRVKDSAMLSEVAGAPITMMLTYMLLVSIVNADVWAVALYSWWGGGFGITVLTVLTHGRLNRTPDWNPYKYAISWGCKLGYVFLMWQFYREGMWASIFLFSAWIMNDQVGKAIMNIDTDRTRRTVDDGWIIRLCYPLGLFVPYFQAIPFRLYLGAYGTLLFVMWVSGLVYVYRKGEFLVLPASAATLRNMLYFDKIDSLDKGEAGDATANAGGAGEQSKSR